MGYEKSKRPILAPGITVSSGAVAGATGPATVSGDLDLSGDVRIAGNLSVTGTVTDSGQTILATESLLASNTLQTLSASGLSFISSTSSTRKGAFKLPTPSAGLVKKVVVGLNQSPTDVWAGLSISTPTTDLVFWGTTFNTIRPATDQSTSLGGSPILEFIGRTSTSWAIGNWSTALFDIVGTTGSTDLVDP